LNIYGTFWNQPEGCVSLITDYCPAACLANLIGQVGGLPEHILKDIATSALSSLEQIHNQHNSFHGGIRATQILFDRKGNVRLSFGFSSIVKQEREQGLPGITEMGQPNSPSRFKRHSFTKGD